MISKVHLTAFRNFEDKVFSFSPKITIIVGPNAIGKTNLLESIYLLSVGKSFKAHLEEEMISYSSEIGRVKGKVINEKDKTTLLEVILTRGEIGRGTTAPERVPRKKLLVNGVSRRLVDFSGNLKTVLFGPWDLDLVTESPSLRRRFLDNVLSQVDKEYRRAIVAYERGLRQRNQLLYTIREEGTSRQQLYFWDRFLIKNGDYVSSKRDELINFINSTNALDSNSFYLEYDKSAISEARLEQYKSEEVAAATTLIGPHRDDFVFKQKKMAPHFKTIKSKKVEDMDLSKYGSRGEQRMSVLWLKIAELAFVEEKSGEKPTLILDDIFSELDHNHRSIVMNTANNQQTIISTADPHFVEKLENVELIELGKQG
ncbi:DNA replication and repair protein RecF [Candidatus Woesebacteria bacterium]|nr:DNA replication and repair protein RecF [Candidatus Woesebacteria bacterium]